MATVRRPPSDQTHGAGHSAKDATTIQEGKMRESYWVDEMSNGVGNLRLRCLYKIDRYIYVFISTYDNDLSMRIITALILVEIHTTR